MAYVNVAEWSPDQSADWLKGVGGGVAVYASLFLSNEVHGQQLLSFRANDLEDLDISTIGHQELILEAVAQLRNFHYELDRENLQYLALKLSCAATSLYKELLHHQDNSNVDTQSLSDVANVISMAKPLALWLDRSPFSGQTVYSEKKSELLKLSLEMATSAQRDRFAESPLQAIRDSCQKLAILADTIIQEIADPMVLQPATLDLIPLKKRENELGFDILPNINGIHQVIDIKFGSPAHASGKIEDGDEIVQVNYQTVVGWHPNEVSLLCQESPIDVLLTLKKRPQPTHGQIYMKPYRLPSKKRSSPYNKWGSIPSPRPELLTLCKFEMPLPKPSPVLLPPPSIDTEDNSSSDESEMLSPPGTPTTIDHVSSQQRIYMPKPRSVVQRRNSISGSIPMSKRGNLNIEMFWRELKNHKSLQHSGSAQITDSTDTDDISDGLCRRDKSLSCSTGLKLSPRPNTCLGVGLTHSKVSKMNTKLLQNNAEEKNIKTVKFQDDPNQSNSSYDDSSFEKDHSRERGKLDKSHSTPAYDFGECEDNEYSLMKEIIPESPTSLIDSPLIIIHSPQKIEQILEFKKSSEQIGGAMIQQQAKTYLEDRVNNINDNRHEDVNKILHTINTALIEKDIMTNNIKKTPNNIFVTEFGESYMKNSLNIKNDDDILVVHNECVETVNEISKLPSQNITETKHTVNPDVPPEPPPRPLSTQKPGYVPPKPRNIQKEDIQVIPNVHITPPVLPQRKEVSANNAFSDYQTGSNLLYENKHAANNLSTMELSSPRSPMMSSRSLQKLEPEQKLPISLSHSNINKIDTSIANLKCNTLESPKLTNNMVRGILNPGKSKNLKKKNSILAKRRKVSVKDLGPGDMQGFVYQRCRTKNSSNFSWKRRWFILTENTFYGYKRQDSSKAECLIFLSGFTVSIADEVKSKPYAFRVYHTGTVFYFACDDSESMESWVEYIGRATLTNNDSWERASKKHKNTDESKHFSETDYSDDEASGDGSKARNEKTKSSDKQEKEKSHKFGSLKKFATRMNKSDSHENVSHTSTSLDRKYLGFFTSRHKHKEEKKLKSNDVPVPTEQYRSYRKIPNSISASLQTDDILQPQTSKTTNSFKDELNDKVSQNVAKIKKIESIETAKQSDNDSLSELTSKEAKKSNPMNYIHASNPNLLEFDRNDFITKPLFFKNREQRPDNFIGFVTLEQFMLNKQEEERRQVYSNRVLMGVERDLRKEEKKQNLIQEHPIWDDNLQRQLDKIVPDVIYGEIPTFMEKNVTPAKVEKIQNRSLPRTPDDRDSKTADLSSDDKKNQADSTKPDKRSYRLNLKKKNDGYETIKYDEMKDFAKKCENMKANVDSKEFILYAQSLKHKNEPTKVDASNQDVKKEFGYEIIYEDNKSSNSALTNESKYATKASTNVQKDLGYETIYGDNGQEQEAGRSPLSSSSSNTTVNEVKITPRKSATDVRKPVPPPKTKPKHSISRQSSLTSVGDRKSSGIDTRPVFKQGDSPEKFWLDSLRRHDKVYSTKTNDNPTLKSDKFYTKYSESYMKSSEATIVKSEKLQNKTLPNSEQAVKSAEHKPLKSATQYTPMSLPLMSPNKALKTSPKFELSLDSRDTPPVVSGISRFRQMFQHGNSSSKTTVNSSPVHSTPKEKTLLGSPRLHRAIFRKHQNSSAADEWSKDFSYSKISPPATQSNQNSDSFAYSISSNEPVVVSSSYDATNLSNASTPDYPHLEYPPVFEPETYSLADPGPSILRKMNHDSEKK